MKKYIKPFLLVLFNNVFLVMLDLMVKDYENWGIIPILIIGFLWFNSFFILVVGMRYTTPPEKADIIDNNGKR